MKKTNVFLCLLCFFTTSIFAQETSESHFLKRSQFGIFMGAKVSNENFKTVDFSTVGLFDELQSVQSETKPGFSLGILFQYQLNSIMAVRTQGVLSFMESTLFYDLTNEPDVTRTREMVRIETPVHLIFEKQNRKISPSLFFGAKYSYDVAHGESTPATNFRKDDILADVGLGVSFTFKRFKFKPEFVYSRGLLNQISGESTNALNNVFDELYSNQYSLRFVFYN